MDLGILRHNTSKCQLIRSKSAPYYILQGEDQKRTLSEKLNVELNIKIDYLTINLF